MTQLRCPPERTRTQRLRGDHLIGRCVSLARCDARCECTASGSSAVSSPPESRQALLTAASIAPSRHITALRCCAEQLAAPPNVSLHALGKLRPVCTAIFRTAVVAQHTGRDQVCELFAPNSGRDPVPNVIKRTRLPRNFQGLRRDFAATRPHQLTPRLWQGCPTWGRRRITATICST